jgi:hypothetical protein
LRETLPPDLSVDANARRAMRAAFVETNQRIEKSLQRVFSKECSRVIVIARSKPFSAGVGCAYLVQLNVDSSVAFTRRFVGGHSS